MLEMEKVIVEALVNTTKPHLANLTDDGRMKFFDECMADYCRYCGRYVADLPRSCQCNNDE